MDTDVARPLRVALAQLNSIVGDLAGNTARMIEWTDRARAEGADIVVFPELAITGYPPEDLLLKPSFILDNLRHRDQVVAASRGIAVVGGFVDAGVDIQNAAFFAHDGALKGVYHKVYLPNYGVFDEERYFQRGRTSPIFELAGVRIGVSICEDAWYPTGPITLQAASGAQLLININGSPYHRGKRATRETMIATRAMDAHAFLAWVNVVGGQDELVFDGNSVVFDPEGRLLAHAASFQEELLVADLDIGSVFGQRLHDSRLRKEAAVPVHFDLDVSHVVISEQAAPAPAGPRRHPVTPPLDGPAEVYAALVTGTGDYVRKSGAFERVLLGLSGGIDSSLTACVAVDALGRENVAGVLMPSRYTSRESLEDACQLAEALGIRTFELPIEAVREAYGETLAGVFAGQPPGLAEENIQARIRGNLLMALSNKLGWMVLTTGNKSEMATGYCTLYGDMAGGFAVLKDIPKTTVYELCRYRNSLDGPVIPPRVLEKAPSAELRENQRDADSLPPYEQLDPILEGYVEDDRSFEELVAGGHDSATVRRVISLVDRSEYKRRQGAPGVKITPRAFGRDRRMPITNRYLPDGVRGQG
ncbi:MAG TPA: NAD+ synthase [Candidatus Dormibacteraeota bacterium]|nr:NAD+ synthase [Candidatus Dormibacteraeota bacterium]